MAPKTHRDRANLLGLAHAVLVAKTDQADGVLLACSEPGDYYTLTRIPAMQVLVGDDEMAIVELLADILGDVG